MVVTYHNVAHMLDLTLSLKTLLTPKKPSKTTIIDSLNVLFIGKSFFTYIVVSAVHNHFCRTASIVQFNSHSISSHSVHIKKHTISALDSRHACAVREPRTTQFRNTSS